MLRFRDEAGDERMRSSFALEELQREAHSSREQALQVGFELSWCLKAEDRDLFLCYR